MILEEFMEHLPIERKTQKMSTCNHLDLGTLWYRLVLPKNLLKYNPM